MITTHRTGRLAVFPLIACAAGVTLLSVAGCNQEHHRTVTKTVDETPTEKTKTVEKHDIKTETQQK